MQQRRKAMKNVIIMLDGYNRRPLQPIAPICCAVSASTSHRQYHKESDNRERTNKTNSRFISNLSILGCSLGVVTGLYYYNKGKSSSVLTAAKLPQKDPGQSIVGLPFYTIKDVSSHDNKEKRIWVTYKQGVYDITDFVAQHPGGDKILMAAGGSVEPFWHLYGVHKQPEILAILENFRIGNLSEDEAKNSIRNLSDPYGGEPSRHPALKAASVRPYNAEPPSSLLAESFITPVDLFYVRNHLPVPEVNVEEYSLSVEGIGVRNGQFSLADLKRFPKYTITASIQCAGNRRKEMSKIKQVKGLSWDVAAIGNATFSGARLRDVLMSLGLKDNQSEAEHIQFEGLDTDASNTPYGASIPIGKALDPNGDVLLAYEMNGKPLTRDHGFPVRVIVPGTVGARNVKWLGAIIVSKEESPSHWQQNDYKGFSPSIDWDTVDFSKSPAIQELPVTSAFCEPADNETVFVQNGKITVKGYAWSGGGKQIIRIDISPDQGKTWYVADKVEQDVLSKSPRHWAWTLWHAEIPVDDKDKKLELWVKAVDSSYNTQPEKFDHIWNLRGVLGNAYHKINVNLKR